MKFRITLAYSGFIANFASESYNENFKTILKHIRLWRNKLSIEAI